MIEEIKDLRIKIDGLAQLTKELKPSFKRTGEVVYGGRANGYKINSKEIEQSVDSLYLAKAWLSIMLKELGTSSPYKSGYKTKEDIEPTADTIRILEEEKKYIANKPWNNLNHIERVDWLRQEIQKLIDNTEDFSENIDYIKLEQGFVYKYLSEARFWLGFELQRIKERNNDK